MRRCLPPLAVLAAIGVAAPARADQIIDQIRQAEAAYAQSDFGAALTALDGAAALIRQRKAVGAALLGGGSSAERRYRGPVGTVEVSLIADSPMLQSVAALLGVGLLVSGSDLLVIDGQRVSYDANDDTLQAIVADKVLVKVQGSPGVPKATLEEFFRRIRLHDIEKAAH